MTERLNLGTTDSVCPVCLNRVQADRIAEGDKIYLEKECPEHGHWKILIWHGLDLYRDWCLNNEPTPKEMLHQSHPSPVVNGCPYDCGLCDEHQNDSCAVVLEITNRCNLKCPVCFADSGRNAKQIIEPDIATIRSMLVKLKESAGLPPVQFSGGEPTLRDDLPELVAMAADFGFPHLQVNTNGVRIANDKEYLKKLRDAGLSVIYLQWDGMDDDIYRKIRGTALVDTKLAAIRNCTELEMGVILVPTLVSGINDQQIGEIIQFAKRNIPTVRGVHFQPVSYFGRFPGIPQSEEHITIPRVIELIELQTAGELNRNNFVPLKGCENPRCSFAGFFVLGNDGKLMGTSTFEPIKSITNIKPVEIASQKARRYVSTKWKLDKIENKCSCSCKKDSWEEFFQRSHTHYLCISGMAFQDAWDMEIERLKRCCIHVFTVEGKLIPLCAYYCTGINGNRLYSDSSQNKSGEFSNVGITTTPGK